VSLGRRRSGGCRRPGAQTVTLGSPAWRDSAPLQAQAGYAPAMAAGAATGWASGSGAAEGRDLLAVDRQYCFLGGGEGAAQQRRHGVADLLEHLPHNAATTYPPQAGCVRKRARRCRRLLPGSPLGCLDGGSLEMSVPAVTVRTVAEALRDRHGSSRPAARYGQAGGGPAVRAGLPNPAVGGAVSGTSAGPGSPIVARGRLGASAGFCRGRG
jgi:hypothetical protein